MAKRLVASAIAGRSEELRQELGRLSELARFESGLRLRYFAQDAEKQCLLYLSRQAEDIWGGFRRVLPQSRTVWTPNAREQLLEEMKVQLEACAGAIDEIARGIIAPLGNGFMPFAQASVPRLLVWLGAELDLLAIQHQPRSIHLQAALDAPRYGSPSQHWRKMERFLEASPRDLPNAVGEAMRAAEAMAKIVTGEDAKTFGDCLKLPLIRSAVDPALLASLGALWGFASNSPGIRHAGRVKPTISEDEARYAIELCEAGMKLLLSLDARAT